MASAIVGVAVSLDQAVLLQAVEELDRFGEVVLPWVTIGVVDNVRDVGAAAVGVSSRRWWVSLPVVGG